MKNITLDCPEKQVTAFIGPSGCGKSTLLRCLNRMNDLVETSCVTSGEIRIMGKNIHAKDVDPIELRKNVGMVFQKYSSLPWMTVLENVALGLKYKGVARKEREETLRYVNFQ